MTSNTSKADYTCCTVMNIRIILTLFFFSLSLFTVHLSPFTLHCSLFTVHRSLFTGQEWSANVFLYAEQGISSIYSQDSEPSVAQKLHVVTSDGVPLDNVFIVFGEKVFTTDDDGYVTIKSIPVSDDVTVSFYRTGYHKKDVPFAYLRTKSVIVMQRKIIDVYGLTIREERVNTGAGTLIRITPELAGKPLSEIVGKYGDISGLSLPGERQTISLGGHHTRHLVIMVDGVPINKAGQPVDLSTIPTANLESVEIIRGGGSAEAGAGAIAGAINLVTRRGSQDNEYSIRQFAGSFGYFRSIASAAINVKPLWFDFMADTGYSKNDFSYINRKGEQVKRDFNDKAFQRLYLKTVYRQAKMMFTHKVDYHGFQNKMPGQINRLPLYEDSRLEGYGLKNDVQMTFLLRNNLIESTLYYYKDRVTYNNTRSPSPFFHIIGEHYDQKKGASLSFNYHYKGQNNNQEPRTNQPRTNVPTPVQQSLPIDQIAFTGKFSAAYNREDFEYREPARTKNSIPQIYSENTALSKQSQLTIPIDIFGLSVSWHNDAALRYDISNRWEDRYSYRYVSSYNLLNPDLLIGFSLSSNYSLPSFYDLYWKGDSQAAGNPDLLPEESTNIRFFGDYSVFGAILSAHYEKSNVNNLIYWFRSVTGWKPDNIAAAEIREYNLSLDVNRFEMFDMSFSYSNVEAINKTENDDGSPSVLYGKRIMYKPVEHFNANIRTSTLPVMISLSHSYTGEQYSTPDQLIPPLPGYHLTDVEIGYGLVTGNVKSLFSLSLNNIFDNMYEIYAHTPQPGFNWTISLSLTVAHTTPKRSEEL